MTFNNREECVEKFLFFQFRAQKGMKIDIKIKGSIQPEK
jgi:hypothetical protein